MLFRSRNASVESASQLAAPDSHSHSHSHSPWLRPEFATRLDRVRQIFRDMRAALEPAGVGQDQLQPLTDLVRHLDDLFLVVVVGEFNSGKSATLNALFGEVVCPEGPVPTTDKINVLKFGPTPVERHVGDWIVERFRPFEQLRSLNLVDTPGTNSIVAQHQQITETFVPRADLVLFITSFDRPYSQSEKQFLGLIAAEWRKKVVFALTKIDGAGSEADIEKVSAFIRHNCEADFGFAPTILPIQRED